MTGKALTPREKRVRRHNVSTLVAFLSFTVWITAFTAFEAEFGAVRGIASLLFLAALVVMFTTRNADEYTAAIWRAGTSLAFVVTVGFMFFAPAIEGFLDGLFEGFTKQPTERDLDTGELLPLVALASFFIANAWTRIRGTF